MPEPLTKFDGRSWGAFLRRVEKEVPLPLTPREYLSCERLLASWSGHRSRAELRAGLASLLARDPAEWQAIGRLFDHHVDAPVAAGVVKRDLAGVEVIGSKPVVAPSLFVRISSALHDTITQAWESLVNLPRLYWLGAMVLPVVLYLGLAPMFVPPVQEQEAPTRNPHPPIWIPPETAVRPATLDPLQEAEELSIRSQPETIGALTAFVLLGFSLALLGFRCLGLLAAVPLRVRDQVAARERDTEGRRARAEEDFAERGGRLMIPYHVDTRLPLAAGAVLDSAEWLGRLSRNEPGRLLEPVHTVKRTVAAGGRFTPVMADAGRRHEVLLLIDVEQGDHPWLGGFWQVVNLWRRQGVSLMIYEFQTLPQFVVDPVTRQGIALESLARRSQGMPLIVFSRRLSPFALAGARAPWLSALRAWPVKAWIDPEPLPPERRSANRLRELALLVSLGLARFSLTEEGLLGLARWLASEGEGKPAGLADVGRTAAEPAARQRALTLWALAGSLVPDPSWDQLEAIRGHFPEINTVFERAQDIVWLLEWVASEIDDAPEARQGRVLNLPPEHQKRWLGEYREARKTGDMPWDFEERVRHLLLEQLGSEPPDDPYLAAWWRMKHDLHSAMLYPERARELLGDLFDSTMAREVRISVDAELERHEMGRGCGWGPATQETFARLAGRQQRLGIDVRELVWGERSVWRGALMRALMVLPLAAFAAWGASRVLPEDLYPREVTLPATLRLVTADDDQPLLDWLPRMVALPGGTFSMGSLEGDLDELPVRDVAVDPYALSATEVTVAQYARCVDAGECEEPDSGSGCNWGADPARDDHPVNCVSWSDAGQFAAFVSRWLPETRLPTEAEWEYAARDGGKDITYPWGDAEASCAYAVIDGCWVEGTAPVCSTPRGSTSAGICDLAGNVWEWVADDWHDDYEGAPADGSAWVDAPRGAYRVLRGGPLWFGPRNARAADRSWIEPGHRFDYLGFRLSRSLPSEP